MASPNKTTTTNSDIAFNKQVDAARDALKNFSTIAQLNAPGLIKTAMEELVTVVVSQLLHCCLRRVATNLFVLCRPVSTPLFRTMWPRHRSKNFRWQHSTHSTVSL